MAENKIITFDSYPVDVSIEWAKSQQTTDRSLVQEASSVSERTEVSIATPSFRAEEEALFGLLKRNAPYADFFPPPEFAVGKRELFSYTIAPSLGTEEQLKAAFDRVQKSDVKEEKEQLLTFYTTYLTLVKDLSYINNKRGEFQKG